MLLGVPGIILQIVGRIMAAAQSEGMSPNQDQATIGIILMVLGTILLMIGLAYYAMAKKQNPALCLFAFLGIIGLIVLACFPDKSSDEDNK